MDLGQGLAFALRIGLVLGISVGSERAFLAPSFDIPTCPNVPFVRHRQGGVQDLLNGLQLPSHAGPPTVNTSHDPHDS